MADRTTTVSVSRDIEADPELVWKLISDVTRMGDWSPETTACTWQGNATGPAVGARFKGANRLGSHSWSTVARVIEAEPGRCFAFRVSSVGLQVADWAYVIEPTPSGCAVTETWTDRRGWIATTGGRFLTGVSDRAEHNRAGMIETLERVAGAAEAVDGAGGPSGDLA